MVPKSAKKDPGSAPKSQNDTHGAKLKTEYDLDAKRGVSATKMSSIWEPKFVQKSIEKAFEARTRGFIFM